MRTIGTAGNLNGFHVKDYIAIKEREYAENERRKAERDQDT